eukprot:CAMPEP_0113944222 /NCGR_PEP_ID=MMETSP1339-20121228/31761_1 /TAXON_ID=94617 /ORGANISM="Fibrocapsa japonica" /LENGTH=157 /DNA_ID=CAMNT_0000949339 /DNA_START=67 /DNA_END=536 /DNA_ORIENTATION=- /assembly_acc=CAM_ASM_000762
MESQDFEEQKVKSGATVVDSSQAAAPASESKPEVSALNDILGITDPAPYYWEEPSSTDNPLPLGRRVFHNFYWAAEKIVDGMEFAGECVAHMLGLNQSQYQYVIDAMEIDRMRAERHREEEQAKKEYFDKLAAESAQQEAEVQGVQLAQMEGAQAGG